MSFRTIWSNTITAKALENVSLRNLQPRKKTSNVNNSYFIEKSSRQSQTDSASILKL